MSSIHDLLAQKAAIEQKIAEAQRSARADAVAKVKALMAEYGLSTADLTGKGGVAKAGKSGAKVAPKYRDKASGQTWTGRGLKPKWLQHALASGKKLEDFAI